MGRDVASRCSLCLGPEANLCTRCPRSRLDQFSWQLSCSTRHASTMKANRVALQPAHGAGRICTTGKAAAQRRRLAHQPGEPISVQRHSMVRRRRRGTRGPCMLLALLHRSLRDLGALLPRLRGQYTYALQQRRNLQDCKGIVLLIMESTCWTREVTPLLARRTPGASPAGRCGAVPDVRRGPSICRCQRLEPWSAGDPQKPAQLRPVWRRGARAACSLEERGPADRHTAAQQFYVMIT